MAVAKVTTASPTPRLMDLLFLLLLLVSHHNEVNGILQTAELSVFLPSGGGGAAGGGILPPSNKNYPSYKLLASQASFGAYPEMLASQNPVHSLVKAPDDNPLLCDNVTSPGLNLRMAAAMLVPRGQCTFETKAYNAQLLGASAVIIYGSLASRYAVNETNRTKPYSESDIVYPSNYNDYDCNYGRAEVPSESIDLDNPLPYNSKHNDPLLSGNTSRNVCLQNDKNHLTKCQSKACLLTGERSGKSNESLVACCAWDLPIWLYADDAFSNWSDGDAVNIPAIYLTMQQGNQLLRDISKYGASGSSDQPAIQVILSARWRSSYNLSSYLIWALGVAVAALAAYMSADDYHRLIRRAIRKRDRISNNQDNDRSSNRRSNNEQRQPRPSRPPEETMELTPIHAVLFIVLASTSLLVLFYFKIYNVVKILYALGCSKACSQVVFDPLLRYTMKSVKVQNRVVWRTNTEDFGDISARDVASHIAGFVLGIAWLVTAHTVRHPDNLAFFWITQDLFGAAMCITFLQVVKLNSLNVASILLLVAFFYDIFFVFISPLFFNKSVMITVATSGGPPKADPLWCEKYADDPDCQGGDPLPMLFTIPRINDYQGGSSLLGLGDIVLPGLLLSFAARFDAAKSLLGILGGGNGSPVCSHACPERRFCGYCSLCSGGYFFPMVVAYGVGLAAANAAVYFMSMGQPALLYLVPSCLGTMAFMGWRRSELKELWQGPKTIRAADDILYGEDGGSGHAPLPTDENGYDANLTAPTVPSAAEDDEGGLLLLEDNTQR